MITQEIWQEVDNHKYYNGFIRVMSVDPFSKIKMHKIKVAT